MFNIPENLSRKEREALFRKNHILLSALDIFSEKGYEHTTLDEIADKSEIGKGTVYNYFKGKEDIYISLLAEITKEHLLMLQKSSEETEDLRGFLSLVISSMFDLFLKNKKVFKLLLHIRTSVYNVPDISSSPEIKTSLNKIVGILTERINKAISSGEIKKYDSQSLAMIFKNMIIPYIHGIAEIKQNINVKDEADFLTEVLFKGISNK